MRCNYKTQHFQLIPLQLIRYNIWSVNLLCTTTFFLFCFLFLQLHRFDLKPPKENEERQKKKKITTSIKEFNTPGNIPNFLQILSLSIAQATMEKMRKLGAWFFLVEAYSFQNRYQWK